MFAPPHHPPPNKIVPLTAPRYRRVPPECPPARARRARTTPCVAQCEHSPSGPVSAASTSVCQYGTARSMPATQGPPDSARHVKDGI